MDVIQTIERVLNQFGQEAIDSDRLGERYSDFWKQEILFRLSTVGKQIGLDVQSKWNGGDCVYDLCWLERQHGIATAIPLVLQCEWNPPPKIEHSLERLMACRADLRVLIFDATFPWETTGKAKAWGIHKIDEMMIHAARFKGSQPGDAYLFCCWYRDRGGMGWHYDSRTVT